jgi:protein-tyrosine phosphatase
METDEAPRGQAPQETRLPEARVVDLHSHLMPAVDDGAADVEESRSALDALLSDGVRALVTTPHLDASLLARAEAWAARADSLDAAWAALLSCSGTRPSPELRRGAEVRLDVPEPDLSDARVRLGGGPFVLVEFPWFTVPPRSSRVLTGMRSRDWIPVVAHPERYRGLAGDSEVIQAWRRAGACLQVNHGSLTGRYGATARELGLLLLDRGWADYLSSDYHARGRTEIRAVRELLEELGGAEQATLLMETNPARLLQGLPPLPVPPLGGRPPLRERLASVFR